MRIALIAEPGCLEYARKELNARFGVQAIITRNTYLEANASEQEVLKIMYCAQSIKRVLLMLGSGKARTMEEFEESIAAHVQNKDLKRIASGKTIRAECERIGEHDYNSMEAERSVCEAISKETRCSINLKSPSLVFYAYIDRDDYVVGLDLAGRDLCKRQYKVFTNPVELKGTIAFSFLMFSGYQPGMVLVDPFALSGTIPIEAALYESGMPVNYYNKQFSAVKSGIFSVEAAEKALNNADKSIKKPGKPKVISMDASFRNVSAQKKNAKIAGVEKHIAFSRTDTDWLDVKMKEQKASLICTKPLEPSRSVPERKARDSYKALFRRAKDALSKNGFLCLAAMKPEVLLEEARIAGYREIETRAVWQGKQQVFFTKLETSE